MKYWDLGILANPQTVNKMLFVRGWERISHCVSNNFSKCKRFSDTRGSSGGSSRYWVLILQTAQLLSLIFQRWKRQFKYFILSALHWSLELLQQPTDELLLSHSSLETLTQMPCEATTDCPIGQCDNQGSSGPGFHFAGWRRSVMHSDSKGTSFSLSISLPSAGAGRHMMLPGSIDNKSSLIQSCAQFFYKYKLQASTNGCLSYTPGCLLTEGVLRTMVSPLVL